MTALPAAPMNSGRFSAAQSRLEVNDSEEAWNRGAYVAGKELVGMAGRRGVGPLVAHEQEGAEATRLRLQALDLRDGVVNGPDDGEARGVEGIDERLEILGVGCERERGHSLEIVDPFAEPEGDVGHGLFFGVRDMHRADESPCVAVHRGAELGGALLHHVPVRAQHVEAPGGGGADGEQAAAETAGRPRARRRHLRGHRHLGEGTLVRAQLQAGLGQGEPVGFHGHRLAGQQQQDRLEGFFHHVALPGRVDAHHEGVGGQCAGSGADHDPAAGEVVEQDHAVRQQEGVVIREGGDAGAEADVVRCAAAAAAMKTSGEAMIS